MSLKECKFCDQCGQQMTVFDSDGDAIHQGFEIKGELAVVQTQKTRCGSSYRGVFNSRGGDICSIVCLKLRFSDMLKALEVKP